MISYKIKRAHATSHWAGGTTTELYIYPEDSTYKMGNFQFRISTAKVEVEESTFTSLPGVDRQLMVLDGQMELDHTEHHTSLLHPLDIDCFKGDWITNSKGKCTDFNLLCKPGIKGRIKGFIAQESSDIRLDLHGIMNFLYVHSGRLVIDNEMMQSGDLMITSASSESLFFRSEAQSTIAIVEIDQLP